MHSWHRGRVRATGLHTGADPERTKHTQTWGEIPQLHSVWEDLSLLPALAACKDPHLPLGRDWSKNPAADPTPKTASKAQLWHKSLCCIIPFYRILSTASLHVLNRALILRCLDSSFISGDDHTSLQPALQTRPNLNKEHQKDQRKIRKSFLVVEKEIDK